MKKVLTLLMLFLCLVSYGNASEKFRYDFFDTFDTLISIVAFCDNKNIFDDEMAIIHEKFRHYHQLFDIYNPYPNINNLFTLNQEAHKKPIIVEKELFDFLQFVKQLQTNFPSGVNIASGNLLKIWHKYREHNIENHTTLMPTIDELKNATLHCNFNKIILNDTNFSVYFEEPLTLDVGAIAKGYATEKVSNYLYSTSLSHFIINAGGNVCAGNSPQDNRIYWGIGIADPNNPQELLDTAFIKNASIVTSGDYQRYFMVNNQKIHHIIDLTTLFPANHFKSVSVYAQSSALADYFSTALFSLPLDKGQKLLKNAGDIEALWVLPNDSIVATNGFKSILKSYGATSNIEHP